MKPSSQNAFSMLEIMIVVLLIGLLMSVALPALQKVRYTSQEKAVINNARRLAQAADQYFLETGATSAASASLVGATLYVKALGTVAGESYPQTYVIGQTITVTGVANARTITYAP